MSQNDQENAEAQRAWNINAEFWDKRMADGNDFFNILVWPAVEKLLQPAEGDRLLDVACGNGVAFNQRHFGVVPLQFGIEVLTPAVALRRIK